MAPVPSPACPWVPGMSNRLSRSKGRDNHKYIYSWKAGGTDVIAALYFAGQGLNLLFPTWNIVFETLIAGPVSSQIELKCSCARQQSNSDY